MRVYKAFNLTLQTLFLSISLLNRILKEYSKSAQMPEKEKMMLIAIICLSLASRYNERVNFKVSQVALNLKVTSAES